MKRIYRKLFYYGWKNSILLLIAFEILLYITPVQAVSIEEIMINANDLKGKCQLIDGEHYSGQAYAQFSMDIVGMITGIKAEMKAYQSFKCGKEKGTIYYYQYLNESDALKSVENIQKYIWGGSKPSQLHPEEIFRLKNIIVVVSSRQPKVFTELLSNKQLVKKQKEADYYFNQGNTYLDKGQYDQAISDFNKAIGIDPQFAEAYNNRGNAYHKKGQYDQAFSDYSKAIDLDSRNAIFYLNRAEVYEEKGQFGQAMSDFNKAIEINPRYAEAYYHRGHAYGQKGLYDLSISDYTKAIEISPKYIEAYCDRGLDYVEKGQYDQAISDYEKAIEIDPKSAYVYNNFAWLLATAKTPGFRNGKKAVELALTACELSNWKDPRWLDTLAAAYARVGDFGNAVKWQEKALESPELAKDSEVQQRLNLYRKHKAWPPD